MRTHLISCTALLMAGASLYAIPRAHAEAPFDFAHTPGKLPKTVVPDDYTIDIVPDLKKLTLTGHETIALHVDAPTATITLNQKGLTLTGAAAGIGRRRGHARRTTTRRPRP